jgi:hydroxymethylpyrimidine pyrophosphatase-like HAD family hydrolase
MSASHSDRGILLESPEALRALARVEVLYTDLDGTLLGRNSSVLADDEGEPTLETAEAIVAVNRARLTVVMVSGRNALQLAETTRILGWTDFIGEVGCVRSVGRSRELSYSTGDWTAEMVPEGLSPYEAIAEAGALDVLETAFPGRIERHMPWDSDRLATHMLRGDVDAVRAQEILDTLPLPIDIVDNGIIRPPRHTLVGVGQIHAYHLVPRGSSKARAIAEDLAARGLAREQAAAVGDSPTDLAMAASVGLFVLVANGLDSPGMAERIEATENAYVTHARQGHGWAELALAWVESRA